ARAADRTVGQHRRQHRPAPAFRGAGQPWHAPGVAALPDVGARRDPALQRAAGRRRLTRRPGPRRARVPQPQPEPASPYNPRLPRIPVAPAGAFAMPDVAAEAARRRTFAIISHPDAGKTTLTEKLLLFGGAIQMAGSVKSRKTSRSATSDWMALEKERGISVTSSVMQFP